MPLNNETLADFEFHSAMEPIEFIKVWQLIKSHPEFAGMAICSDGPLPADKIPKNIVPVVIKMPRSINAPDFWRELNGALSQKNPVVEDVVQAALNIAVSPEEKEKILHRVAELKTTSPDWQ